MPKITPFLWFDTQAEDAATFYTGVFPGSKITSVQRNAAGGPGPEGAVLVVQFELDGQVFTALNGGPQNYAFNESVSFVVDCRDQAEVDHYWEKLSEGGEEGPCGWLKDRYGVSWQVVPTLLNRLITDPDQDKAQRVMAAMLQMGKIDSAKLQEAYDAD